MALFNALLSGVLRASRPPSVSRSLSEPEFQGSANFLHGEAAFRFSRAPLRRSVVTMPSCSVSTALRGRPPRRRASLAGQRCLQRAPPPVARKKSWCEGRPGAFR
ncbi:MAG: hypothetical protein MZV63_33935 [Marinilabiliales bacterium]|nr:hypothetical protein [Marinilabiliales bacterium]